MAEPRSREVTEQLVYRHNVLGLENDTPVDNSRALEMRRIKSCFEKWQQAIKMAIEEMAIKAVRGDLTEEQFKAVLQGHVSVLEASKEIPGLLSEKEEQILLRDIIDSILAKLEDLQGNGEGLRIYKGEYQRIKKRLLQILFGCFGAAVDLGLGGYLEISNFDYAIMKLEEMDMIPKGLKEEIKMYLCPVGRWY
jgi:hypothetical protein